VVPAPEEPVIAMTGCFTDITSAPYGLNPAGAHCCMNSERLLNSGEVKG
jgi:hypothetical protein